MERLEKLTPREVFALSPAERQARQDLYAARHQAASKQLGVNLVLHASRWETTASSHRRVHIGCRKRLRKNSATFFNL